MKHITLIQRLWSASHPTSIFISLLALLAGLGSAQAAAPTITSSTVFVSRNGNPNETYNANPGTPTAFDGASLGTYSINGGQLTLNGGTITTTETGTSVVSAGALSYTVYDAGNNTVGTGTLQLAQSGTANNRVRTFTLSNANINLVNLVPTGATGYYVSIIFTANYQNNGTGRVLMVQDNNSGNGGYDATFDVSGTRSATSSISGSSILISPNTTANNTIYGASSGATPMFNGANLGTYDVNSGRLYLNGGTTTVTAANGDVVSNVQLNYLVSAVGSTGSSNFLSLVLNGGNTANGTTTYSLTDAQVNLINTQVGSLGTGNFNIQVFFSAQLSHTDGTFKIISDNNSGNPYKAQFTVVGTPTPSTTWISTTSTDWLNAANWSKGVPDRSTNAVIPAKNATNPPTSTPILDNPTGVYEVQDLTLSGASNSNRALVRVGAGGTGATLRIYGDLNNIAGGLLAGSSGASGTANPLTNSTVVFAGDASTLRYVNGSSTPTSTGGNQKIFGLVEVPDVRIEGTGIKAVYNTLNASNTLVFAPGISAIVRTVAANDSLNTSQTSVVNLKDSGVLSGETNTAYIEGITKADRSLQANTKQTFGNIGIDIMPNRDIPAPNVVITRTVGDPFNGPVGSSARGVKRQYGVTGDVNNNTTSDVVFHYLNSTNELNGNPEPNLVMFRTANNAVPFILLGGTVNLSNQTVTITAYSGPINTVTLGDKNNPLPVTLTSFEAVRKGSSVLVTWATATETNNKGFNVQESADGTTFHNVGFVASQATNSTKALQYSFTDAETVAAGTRYYRLQQTDLDGKVAYFGPRVVQMDGAITANSASAYPNPFTGSLSLELVSPSAGPALVRISDLTGRTVREQRFSAPAGTSTLALDGVSDLKSGVYMLQFVSPTGKTTNLKVVRE